MPQNKSNDYNHQSGNVFVIIFIAVVLFGALGFTFSKSANKGTGNLTKQQAKVAAQDIISYSNLLNEVTNKLRQRGCSENQLSFQYDADGDGDYTDTDETPDYSNSNSPTDLSCHIFHPNGGKLTFREIPENARDTKFEGMDGHNRYGVPFFTATTCNPGTGTASTSCWSSGRSTDKALAVAFSYIKPEICLEINKNIGLPDHPSPQGIFTDQDTFTRTSHFDGGFITSAAQMPNRGGDNYDENNIHGKTAYCGELGSSLHGYQGGSFQYIRLLVVR